MSRTPPEHSPEAHVVAVDQRVLDQMYGFLMAKGFTIDTSQSKFLHRFISIIDSHQWIGMVTILGPLSLSSRAWVHSRRHPYTSDDG